MRTVIFPLLLIIVLASGCASRGSLGSYCGPLPEGNAVSAIAADAVDCLSSLYPPGHTGLHLVPAKKMENGFVQAFESGLRGKGFTLHSEATADAVAVAYTLDALFEKGEERAWYLVDPELQVDSSIRRLLGPCICPQNSYKGQIWRKKRNRPLLAAIC